MNYDNKQHIIIVIKLSAHLYREAAFEAFGLYTVFNIYKCASKIAHFVLQIVEYYVGWELIFDFHFCQIRQYWIIESYLFIIYMNVCLINLINDMKLG